MRPEGLGKLKTSNDLTGTRTRDLPPCSTMPQPTTLLRVPLVRVRSAFQNILECSLLGPPREARREEGERVRTHEGYVWISV
jgi:hypothetical protein